LLAEPSRAIAGGSSPYVGAPSTTRPTSAPRSTALSYALHDTLFDSWVEDTDVSTANDRIDQQFRGLEIAAAAREDVPA